MANTSGGFVSGDVLSHVTCGAAPRKSRGVVGGAATSSTDGGRRLVVRFYWTIFGFSAAAAAGGGWEEEEEEELYFPSFCGKPHFVFCIISINPNKMLQRAV